MMQMKRNLTLSLLILSALCSMAQNEDKSIALGEVVVKAAKVVNKMDGMELYPTEVQKKSSTNGYEILQKLSLPNIKIASSVCRRQQGRSASQNQRHRRKSTRDAIARPEEYPENQLHQ